MTKEQLAKQKYPIVESTGSSHWTRMGINEKERLAFIAGFEEGKPKWIKCSDRLPECSSQHGKNYGSGYVLGLTEYGEQEIVQLWNNKQWEGCNGENGYRIDYISYWMPLPKIPNND